LNLLAHHEVEYIGARPSQEKYGARKPPASHIIATFGKGEKHIIERETKQKEILSVSSDERIQEVYVNIRTIKDKKDCLVKEKRRYKHRFDIKS